MFRTLKILLLFISCFSIALLSPLLSKSEGSPVSEFTQLNFLNVACPLKRARESRRGGGHPGGGLLPFSLPHGDSVAYGHGGFPEK
jgi:hypothetical protein